MKSFNEYLGNGYWIHVDGKYRAIIKITGEGWYAGACTNTERTIPMRGPYRLRRTAKKVALEQLALIQHEDD